MNIIAETIIAFAVLAVSIYLLFYFISLYSKIYQLVKINIGSGTAIIFAVSILLLCCGRNRSQENTALNKYTNSNFKDTARAGTQMQGVSIEQLESTSLYGLNLHIQFAQPYHSKKIIPVSATCSFTGTSFNNKWSTTNVSLSASPDSTQIFYHVSGTMDWSLLGFTFLSSAKNFDGMIEADNIHTQVPENRSPLILWGIVAIGVAGFGWYYLRKYVKKQNG